MSERRVRRAATLVLLREGERGLETLLLRRHRRSSVGSGAWVFPGGVVEDQDYVGDDVEAAARRAASRETREEASIHVPAEDLQFISHWTTPDAPQVARKRFSTWFFLSCHDVDEVVVDGEEIDAHRWYSPEDAIAEHEAGELNLMPPTLVTLYELSWQNSIDQACQFFADREVPYIEPRLATLDDRVCMLYRGDAGYEADDPTLPGPRNRCWLLDGFWRYEFYC